MLALPPLSITIKKQIKMVPFSFVPCRLHSFPIFSTSLPLLLFAYLQPWQVDTFITHHPNPLLCLQSLSDQASALADGTMSFFIFTDADRSKKNPPFSLTPLRFCSEGYHLPEWENYSCALEWGYQGAISKGDYMGYFRKVPRPKPFKP